MRDENNFCHIENNGSLEDNVLPQNSKERPTFELNLKPLSPKSDLRHSIGEPSVTYFPIAKTTWSNAFLNAYLINRGSYSDIKYTF